MKKKWIILIIAITVVLIIAGSVYYLNSNQKQEYDISYFGFNKNSTEGQSFRIELEYCNNLTLEKEISCRSESEWGTVNCNENPDNNPLNENYEDCKKRIFDRGFTNCTETLGSNTKDRCYIDLAKKYKNQKVCELIINETYDLGKRTLVDYNNWCIEEVLKAMKDYSAWCNKRIEERGEGQYAYMGASSFTHGGDPPCHHIFEESYFKNNSEICEGMENSKIKAICIGDSLTSVEEVSECEDLELKDYCLFNAAKKLNNFNLSSKKEFKEVCSRIENESLSALCYGTGVKRFNDTEICRPFNEKERLICLYPYFISIKTTLYANNEWNNKEVLKSKENIKFCNNLFVEDENLFLCYTQSIDGAYLFGVNNSEYFFEGLGDYYEHFKIDENNTREILSLKNISGRDIVYLEYTNFSKINEWGIDIFLCDSVIKDDSEREEKCVYKGKAEDGFKIGGGYALYGYPENFCYSGGLRLCYSGDY